MFSFRLVEHQRLLLIVDFILIELTTLVALWIMAFRAGWVFDARYLTNYVEWFIFLPALWFVSAFLNGVYEPAVIVDVGKSARALLRAVILVIIIYLAFYFFFATPGELPRGVVGYQGALSFVMVILWRALYHALARQRSFARRVIIVGAGWAGKTIAETILQRAARHYHIVGFVDDDPLKQNQSLILGDVAVPVLGTSRDLPRLIKEHHVPEIILAVTHDLSAALFQAILASKEQGVHITLMPVLFEQLTGMVPIEHIGDNWNVALPLDSPEASSFYRLAKRAFDVLGALIGLSLFLPLLPLLAVAIKLDSPGPVFFRQTRVGKGGKPFRLLKLRTMVADAEPNGQAMRAQKNDPRITRVGRWLRKTRLDEMPQLFNVLKGEMSAVGPRPERPEHLEELERAIPFHRLRNAVKPGMAGWAAVNYDYVDSLEDARIRLQYDLYYIKHQSLWLDLQVLWRMLLQILAFKGR
jgi:exopolysaccharide biosynthesis polyprenyl glycosylphosphotransferase